MGILDWFRKRPAIDFHSAKIDTMVFLLNYREHYRALLESDLHPRQYAELFLFRAWACQFGYRIFSTNPELSEKLIGETVNSCTHIGNKMFLLLNKISIEGVLDNDLLSLIEDRWQRYDLVVSTDPQNSGLPTIQIIGELCKCLGTSDPIFTYALSRDFLIQIELVKKTSIELGVLQFKR